MSTRVARESTSVSASIRGMLAALVVLALLGSLAVGG